MRENPRESDWKAFRRMVPELRERYLLKRNQELIAILQNDENTPTEQFWEAESRIQEEAKILRACLDGHSRSKLTTFMGLMYRHGMLTDDDLKSFTDDVRNCIKQLSAI